MRNLKGFGLAAIVGVGLMSFSHCANASPIDLNFMAAGTPVALNFTLGTVSLSGVNLVSGYQITGVSGKVGDLNISNFTGYWYGFAVVGGLFTDIKGAPNNYNFGNVPGAGDTTFDVDNIWYPGTSTHLDSISGVAILLSNGAIGYVYGLCDPGSRCLDPDYGLFQGDPVSSAVPETSTWAMLLLGFFGIAAIKYRRKSKPAFGSPSHPTCDQSFGVAS